MDIWRLNASLKTKHITMNVTYRKLSFKKIN